MLCVHLKRFRHDLTYSSKISSPVNFPIVNLDMRPYLHKDCTSEVSTYDLTAVICHHGTVGGGHYTSFAKHDISGKWFEYDDQLVTEVSADVVQNCEAYVLFYRKSNPQMSIIRHQALALYDTEQASDIRFFVSRHWLNKFKTFAEPGPIDNWALFCPHGGLPPNKVAVAAKLVVPLPQPLWEYLYQKFGGGPACNHLFTCDICQQIADRQDYERTEFAKLKKESALSIYAISMVWLRQWQSFVDGQTDIVPGPINNKSIVKTDSEMGRGVKAGSEYAQINSAIWKFLYSIYEGGPEIVLFRCAKDTARAPPTPTPTTTTTATVQAFIARDIDERMDTGEEIVPAVVGDSAMAISKVPADANELAITPAMSVSPKLLVRSQSNVVEPVETNASHMISATTAAIGRKMSKNVSFEHDDNSTSDREYSSGPSSLTSTDLSITNLKRSKHHYTAVNAQGSEIVNKKDKRHRGGIKSNGMFGPEGESQIKISIFLETASNTRRTHLTKH